MNTEEPPIVAIKYIPASPARVIRYGNVGNIDSYQVWWFGGRCGWRPKAGLNLEVKVVDWCEKNPGVKLKIIRGRSESSRKRIQDHFATAGSVEAVEIEDSKVSGYQKAGKLGALNAAAIALHLLCRPICPQVYSELEEKNPALEKVVRLLRTKENGGFQFIKPKGVENTYLLSWLLGQVAGIFCVEYDNHCIVWDANRKLLVDTDPICPCPVTITDENLVMFGIKTVEKVYQALPKVPRKNPKKRKRTSHCTECDYECKSNTPHHPKTSQFVRRVDVHLQPNNKMIVF
jgi:hypothetical protein